MSVVTLHLTEDAAQRLRDLVLGCGRSEDWQAIDAQLRRQGLRAKPFARPVLHPSVTGRPLVMALDADAVQIVGKPRPTPRDSGAARAPCDLFSLGTPAVAASARSS